MRILAIDDHVVAQQGLAKMLAVTLDQPTVIFANNAQQALEFIWKEEWDIAIMDLSMPGKNGLDLLKELKAERPKLPVLIFSAHSEGQLGIRALQNGAAGYLSKDASAEELSRAVKKIAGGGKYIRSSLAEKLAWHVDAISDRPLHESLSNREYDVMRRIAHGQTLKEIAGEMSLSIKTVSTYRRRIMEKMKMTNNSELMRYCVQSKLIDLDGPGHRSLLVEQDPL
jgi:two-component system invasion response regulator UvrY